MADKKISELVSLAGVDLSDADLIPVVDVSTAEAKAVSISGIKAALAATFANANAAHEIRNAFMPYITWQSPLGDSEMLGDTDYTNIALTAGFYQQMTEATLFNTIQGRMWTQTGAPDVEWKVWIRSSAAGFNMSVETPDASGTIAAGGFPTTNSEFTLALTTPLFAAAGKFVFAMFRAANSTRINFRRWAYNAAISPARLGFAFSTVDGWNNTIAFGNPAAGYGQTAFKLKLRSAEALAATYAASAVSYSGATSGLSATNVQAAIDEMVGANVVPEMVMPPYIYGVEGRECNVYLDNLHLADASEYLHDVTSALSTGKQQNERWTWTPAGAVTTGSLTVSAHEKRTGRLLVTKTTNQRSAAATAGTGLTKKVMMIGDSLVDAGTITQTLLDISGADAMHITLHGTRGTAPNLHEGRGGWTSSQYVSSGSPFYISGAVNFAQYLVNNSIATPDWVFIQLGTNDEFQQTTDAGASSIADTGIVNLNTLIASIKAADASVKIGVMLSPPPSASDDAFGANYSADYSRWRFKRNILIWARQLIAAYTGQEANRIYIVPSNTALDTVNNMSIAASAPVNSRSLVSSTRQNNGVHPATEGYQQIADAVWAFLKFYA